MDFEVGAVGVQAITDVPQDDRDGVERHFAHVVIEHLEKATHVRALAGGGYRDRGTDRPDRLLLTLMARQAVSPGRAAVLAKLLQP